MGSGCGGRYRAVDCSESPGESALLKTQTPASPSTPKGQIPTLDVQTPGSSESRSPAPPTTSVAEIKRRLRELGRKIPDAAIEKSELLALLEEAERDSAERAAAKARAVPDTPQTLSDPATSSRASPPPTVEKSPSGGRSVPELKRRLRELNLAIPINDVLEKKDLVALVEAAEKQATRISDASPSRPATAAVQPRSVAQLKARLQELGVQVPAGAIEKRELFILVDEAERQQEEGSQKTREGDAPESAASKTATQPVQCQKGCRGVTAVTIDDEPFVPASPSRGETIVRGKQFTWIKGKLIGRGALGLVFRAEVDGRAIAVKDVMLDMTDGEESKVGRDLANEIQIMKDLKHDHVVSYLGHDYMDDRLYIYMDYMPGGSMSKVLNVYGPLDETLMAKYMKQLLTGLEYLHERSPPVIHRDIKGGNVLVGQNCIVKWADFGCSKRLDSEKTQTMLRGSVPWMAPEVVANSRYGKSSDVWSFGCLVIEMGSARPPWGNFENQVAALIKIGMSRETPPLPEGVSQDCQGFISLCVQRDAQRRPSASELLEHSVVKNVPLPGRDG